MPVKRQVDTKAPNRRQMPFRHCKRLGGECGIFTLGSTPEWTPSRTPRGGGECAGHQRRMFPSPVRPILGRIWVEKCLVSMVSQNARKCSQTVGAKKIIKIVDTKESFSHQPFSASIFGSIIYNEPTVRIPLSRQRSFQARPKASKIKT